jgi:hypothetical protein
MDPPSQISDDQLEDIVLHGKVIHARYIRCNSVSHCIFTGRFCLSDIRSKRSVSLSYSATCIPDTSQIHIQIPQRHDIVQSSGALHAHT